MELGLDRRRHTQSTSERIATVQLLEPLILSLPNLGRHARTSSASASLNGLLPGLLFLFGRLKEARVPSIYRRNPGA